MKKLACLALVALASCTVKMRTTASPSPTAFHALDVQTSTRDSVTIALGSPQAVGIHRVDREDRELAFYDGLEGEVNVLTGSMHGRSLTAFVSYDGDARVCNLLGFSLGAQGAATARPSKVDIVEGARTIEIGKTSAAQVTDLLGKSDYQGRRCDVVHGVDHEILFYNSSKQQNGIAYERWLMLGYDAGGVIRDMLWTSSLDADLAELGKVQMQQSRTVGTIDYDWPYARWNTRTVAASKKIDAGQVEALLRQRPENVAAIEEVLGLPTSRGFMAFHGQAPCGLAQWWYTTTELAGQEVQRIDDPSNAPRYSAPVPGGNSKPSTVRTATYAVVDVRQTRLIVAHDKDGVIQELYWIRPSGEVAQL